MDIDNLPIRPHISRAAVIIAGAFRTTSGAGLDIKLYLLPVEERLDIALAAALLRIKSGPTYAYLS
jgi:hypothetical protein